MSILFGGVPSFFGGKFGSSILTGLSSVYQILKPKLSEILLPIINSALDALPGKTGEIIRFVAPFIVGKEALASVLSKREAEGYEGEVEDTVRKKRRRM